MRLPGGGGMSTKEFLVGLKNELSQDKVTDIAAGLTYYGVLALFPFLLFLIALASVVIEPADAEKIVQQLASVAPQQVTGILGDRIRSLGAQQNVGLLTVGALGALWAASGGVTAVIRALNTCYDVDEGRPFWKVRGLAVLMTLVASVLSVAAAVAMIATPPIAEAIGGPVGTAVRLLRFPVAGLLMMLLWATMYYVLPDVEQKFKFITPGSVGGVLVWLVASWGFSAYVANFGKYDETYGSLGGVIVLLLWMWISALVLLIGAESNALIEHASEEGKEPGEKEQQGAGEKTPSPPRAGPGGRPEREHEQVPAAAAAYAAARTSPGARGAPAYRARPPDPSRHHSRLGVLLAGLAAGLYLRPRRA